MSLNCYKCSKKQIRILLIGTELYNKRCIIIVTKYLFSWIIFRFKYAGAQYMGNNRNAQYMPLTHNIFRNASNSLLPFAAANGLLNGSLNHFKYWNRFQTTAALCVGLARAYSWEDVSRVIIKRERGTKEHISIYPCHDCKTFWTSSIFR